MAFDSVELGIVTVGVLSLSAFLFARLIEWRGRLRDLGVNKITIPTTSVIWDASWLLFIVVALPIFSDDGLFIRLNLPAKVSSLLLIFGPAALAKVRENRQRRELEKHVVSSGVLHVRIKALACKSDRGVTAAFAVYVVPDGFMEWTAAQGGRNILLKRRFIEWMSRPEIDAVVARQLARQDRYYYLRIALPILSYSLAAAVLVESLAMATQVRFVALLLLLILEVFSLALYAPLVLFQVDLRAIRLTGDAESFISALARLSQLNRSKLEVPLLKKIARMTGVRPDQLQTLVAKQDGPATNRYPLPVVT